MLHDLRDTNNSLLNLKQNETMKLFTVIAFLTLPMTLFLSIISLPTKQKIIIGQENDLNMILGILFIIFILMLIYSIFKKW
jgi:Mg2+ and Co2+ transporter CorA